MLIHSVKKTGNVSSRNTSSEWFKRLIKRWLYTHGYIIDSPLGGDNLWLHSSLVPLLGSRYITRHMDLPNKCGYHQPLDDQPLGYFQHFVPDTQNSDGCRSTWCSPRTWIGQSGAQVPLVPFGDRTLEDFTWKWKVYPRWALRKPQGALWCQPCFFMFFPPLLWDDDSQSVGSWGWNHQAEMLFGTPPAPQTNNFHTATG